MTTGPRVPKFRVAGASSKNTDSSTSETQNVNTQGNANVAASAAPQNDGEQTNSNTLENIRQEGLSGRQLRLARRVAKKHGIAATSDYEAVRLLREQGIDPFSRSSLLDLVSSGRASKQNGSPGEAGQAFAQIASQKLPRVVTPGGNMPSQIPVDPAVEVSRIQRDLARRRKRKLYALLVRLLVFIGVPTAALGYYFYVIATPLYTTHTSFLIQQADSAAGSAGNAGGLFGGGTGMMGGMQDAVAVQEYLTSREAMLRLNEEFGFKEHFSNLQIDAITRLPEDVSNEGMYRTYKKMVEIGYDPTDGMVLMDVTAVTPDKSEEFSRALLSYAEERVDNLTARLRNEQMRGALDAFDDAQLKRQAAIKNLVNLQTELQMLNADGETTSIQSQISQLEVELLAKRLELQTLMDNVRPSAARVAGIQADIMRMERAIEDLRSRLTARPSLAEESLASKTSQLRIAEEDYQTRTMMLQSAMQQLELARVEADRQVRFLSAPTPPVPPDEATYPRSFENTVLSFLIFAGIYLIISLTVSVLREQVAS